MLINETIRQHTMITFNYVTLTKYGKFLVMLSTKHCLGGRGEPIYSFCRNNFFMYVVDEPDLAVYSCHDQLLAVLVE
jgi:hypothetical protein